MSKSKHKCFRISKHRLGKITQQQLKGFTLASGDEPTTFQEIAEASEALVGDPAWFIPNLIVEAASCIGQPRTVGSSGAEHPPLRWPTDTRENHQRKSRW